MSGARAPGAPNASSGVLPPQLPNWNPKWTLADYQKEQELFERKLLDYLRRLNNALSESVIQIVNNRASEVIGIGGPSVVIGRNTGTDTEGSYTFDTIFNYTVGKSYSIECFAVLKKIDSSSSAAFRCLLNSLDYHNSSSIVTTSVNGHYTAVHIHVDLLVLSNTTMSFFSTERFIDIGTILPTPEGQSTPSSGGTSNGSVLTHFGYIASNIGTLTFTFKQTGTTAETVSVETIVKEF